MKKMSRRRVIIRKIKISVFFSFLVLRGEASFRTLIKKMKIKLFKTKSIYNILTPLTGLHFFDLESTPRDTEILLTDIKQTIEFQKINTYEQSVLKAVLELLNHSLKSQDFNAAKKNELETLIFQNQNQVRWDFLEGIEVLLNLAGYFSLSYQVRAILYAQYLEKYQNNARVDYFDVRKLCLIYLANGEFEQAVDLLEKKANTWGKLNKNRHSLLSTLAHSQKRNLFNPYERKNTVERLGLSLIRGKTLALIGPAPNVDRYLTEIGDDWETKVAIGYRGQEGLKDIGIDISYYNKALQIFLTSNKNPEPEMSFLENLQMAICKGRTKFSKHYLLESKVKTSLAKVDDLLFNGYANMMQNVIFDLARYSPARVKCFGFNLFLAKQEERYNKQYKHYQNSRNFDLYGLAFHSISSNYEFTKMLHTLGYLEADDDLAEVLSLGTEIYMQRMEQMFFEEQ